MDDKTMIRKIQRGQTKYLDTIAEKYYDDIYRFCCYRTGLPEDSYDLAQETFLRFIKYVEHYKYRNLKGYLLTIARNVCNDFMRQQALTVPMEDVWQEQQASTDPAAEVIERNNLLSALQKLPEMQRETLILFYYENLKIREIAVITGVGISTVKSRMKQGTEKLRKLLKEGDTC